MKSLGNIFVGITLVVTMAVGQVVRIFPEANTVLKPEELVAAYSLDPSVAGLIKKDSVTVLFNDRTVSSMVRIADGSIIFTPDSLLLKDPDLNWKASLKLKIRYRNPASPNEIVTLNDSTQIFLKGVSSKDDSSKVIEKTPFVNTGTIFTGQSFVNSGDTNHYVGEFGASGNGYKSNFFYNYNLYLNTDENKNSQTMQRFRATAGYGKVVKLSIGDVTPVMNPYIANGDRVRGFELNLATPKKRLNLDAAYGFSKRAVEPYIANDSVLTAMDSALKSIQIDTTLSHNDSSSVMASGTYERRVIGTRIHVGDGEHLKYGLAMMQVRDIVGSIHQKTEIYASGPDTLVSGVSPQDNLMIGQDFALSFWKKRILVSTNMAVSVLTTDIQGGAISTDQLKKDADFDSTSLPFEVSKLEPLIIINTNTLPIPTKEGFLNSSAIDAGISLNTPIGTVREKFDIRFSQIGSNYRSLLNESLPQDRRGLQVKEELRFLQNRVIGSVKVDLYRDNLDDANEEATNTRKVTGMINLNLNENIPQFTVTLSSIKHLNDSPEDSRFYRDNRFLIWNLNSSFTKKMSKTENTFSAYYNNNSSVLKSMVSRDTSVQITRSGENKLTSNGFGVNEVTSFDQIPLKGRIGYNHIIADGDLKTTMVNPTIGVSYTLIPEKLELNSDGRFVHISNEDVLMGRSTTLNRLEGSFSSSYQFNKKNLISFNCTGTREVYTGKESAVYDYLFRLYYEFRY